MNTIVDFMLFDNMRYDVYLRQTTKVIIANR